MLKLKILYALYMYNFNYIRAKKAQIIDLYHNLCYRKVN